MLSIFMSTNNCKKKQHFSNDVEQIRFKSMDDKLLTAVLPPQCQNLPQTLENLSLTIGNIICCTNMLSVITSLILKIFKNTYFQTGKTILLSCPKKLMSFPHFCPPLFNSMGFMLIFISDGRCVCLTLSSET